MLRLCRTTGRTTALAAFCALLFLAACRNGDVTAPPKLEPPLHYPIIFVHGYFGDSTTWSSMVARFRADGWTDREIVNWQYDYNQSNVAIAAQLAAKVDSVLAASGAKHVNLVTHSMGSLVARYYVRNLLPDASTRVDAVVSLAGTNHGTLVAALCGAVSCLEMRPGSAFLASLNAGDETWGTPRYATWWSTCDEAVIPANSALLNGAQNTQTACLSHSQIYQNDAVYQAVREWVRPTRYGR